MAAPRRGRWSPQSAAELIVQTARRAVEPLTLIALGPLTNVALALERDRAALGRLARVVVMGGAVDVPRQRDADGGVQHPRRSRGRRARGRGRAAAGPRPARRHPPGRRLARGLRARAGPLPGPAGHARGRLHRARLHAATRRPRAWCCTTRWRWRPRSIRASSAGSETRLEVAPDGADAARGRRGQLPLRAARRHGPRSSPRSWSGCAPRPDRRLGQRRLHRRPPAAAAAGRDGQRGHAAPRARRQGRQPGGGGAAAGRRGAADRLRRRRRLRARDPTGAGRRGHRRGRARHQRLGGHGHRAHRRRRRGTQPDRGGARARTGRCRRPTSRRVRATSTGPRCSCARWRCRWRPSATPWSTRDVTASARSSIRRRCPSAASTS